jgi:hypothetical protein
VGEWVHVLPHLNGWSNNRTKQNAGCSFRSFKDSCWLIGDGLVDFSKSYPVDEALKSVLLSQVRLCHSIISDFRRTSDFKYSMHWTDFIAGNYLCFVEGNSTN